MGRELKRILNLDVWKSFDKTLYSHVRSGERINETNKLAHCSTQWFMKRKKKGTENRFLWYKPILNILLLHRSETDFFKIYFYLRCFIKHFAIDQIKLKFI